MPVPAGPIVGDRLLPVNFWPKRLEITRIAKTLGWGWPSCSSMYAWSFSGACSESLVLVADSALTKIARWPARLNTTVFLFLPARKPLPEIVIRSPTPTFIGVTLVTTGYLGAVFATAVPAGSARTAAAERAAVVMIWTREKDMPRPAYRPLDELLEALRCKMDGSEARIDLQALLPAMVIGGRPRQ